MSLTTNEAVQIATELKNLLSKNSQVLTDPLNPEFQTSNQRWSDEHIKTPAAILKPASEEDTVLILNTALQNKIPFVPKSGGNSPWSSIDSSGWVIDLSLLTNIQVNPSNQTVTLQSGVQAKTLNIAVASEGFVVQSPTGGAVGYIPFLLGGGSSILAGMYGMAVDSLVSAKVITATKGLVTAAADENPDLFWALKGAGQFFGVVVEVTVNIYKLEWPVISWTCIFLPGQIEEVAGALEGVVNGADAFSPGMCAVLVLPGQTKPLIMVSVNHFKPEAEAEKFMAPLIALNPIQSIKKTVNWGNITASGDPFSKHGGLNAIVSCGLQKFDGKQFIEALRVWQNLADEVPGAAKTMLLFGWYSTEVLKSIPEESTSWSHRDCPVWYMAFTSATDMDANAVALKKSNELVLYCQKDQTDEGKAMFPNHSRGDNLRYRYRGEKRLEKLKTLKRAWDPEGVFTRQFL